MSDVEYNPSMSNATAPTVKVGDYYRYTGSDGQTHAARVTAVHSDGTVSVSVGYYDTRTRVPADAVVFTPSRY